MALTSCLILSDVLIKCLNEINFDNIAIIKVNIIEVTVFYSKLTIFDTKFLYILLTRYVFA